MTQSGSPSGEEPKKTSLKLLLRSKPTAYVDTSAGRIYLYPLRVRDMKDFEKLEPGDALTQIRAFLPSIGSQTMECDEAPERISLNAAVANGLSDNEIEQLADAYAQSSSLKEIREGTLEQKPVTRNADETASAYLLRLVRAAVDQSNESAKRMHEKVLGSSRDLFDQVRKSSLALGSTLSAYEELTKLAKPAPLEIQPMLTDHFEALNRRMVQQARERAEERAEEMELTRLTGQMTAESAKTLRDLAEAATTLMEQMDERDRRTDQSTRKQITIAVWSVGISAVLALFALTVSVFAYFQDRYNNTSGDQWQAKLLTTIEQGNEQRSAAERENQELREQIKALGSRIASMEAVQQAAARSTASKQK